MKMFLKRLKWMILVIALLLAGVYGYKHYQEYQTQKLAEESVIKVACVGDSNTYHYGGNAVKKLNYTYHLKELLGEGYKVRNFGMPGTCVQSDLASPYTDTRAYKASVELEADILVIMLGTNDIWDPGWRDEETFYYQYLSLVDSYLAVEKKPEVYLCTIPGIFLIDLDNEWGEVKATADKINTVISKIAKERNYTLIDVYKFTSLHPEWYDDGIHINQEGAREVASLMYDVLDKGLRENEE